MAGAAGTVAEAGMAAEAGAGTAAVVGTKPVAGMTTGGTSAGIDTGGVARDGEGASLPPNSGMPGAGQDLLARVPAGGIGVMPGGGIILVGDGAQVPGHGVAWSWVHRSV